jgi:arabinogalactan oligomer/maltooligosaccharide transport system substrate-binding protein
VKPSRTLVTVIAATALLATACGSGSSASPSNSGSGSAPKSSASLLIWADGPRAKPLKAMGEKFKADKGVTVTVVTKDYSHMRDDFITEVPTGKGPDIIIGGNDWIGKFVPNAAVAPIQLGDKASQFTKVAIEAMTYDGQVYGVPYAVENIALIRNTTLLPAAADAAWDATVAAGRSAMAKSSKVKFPIVVQTDPKQGDPFHLYPLQTSFGNSVFAQSADGSFDSSKLTIGDAAGLKFAAWLSKQAKDKLITSSITSDVAKNAFLKGQTPYMITGPWNATDFTKAGMKVAIDPLPSAGGQPAKPFVGVQGFFVSAKSKNPLLANDFAVNYLGSEASQKALYDEGGRPPALASAADAIASDPILAGFGKVGAGGTPMPNISTMDAVWTDWGNAELAIINGGDPVKLWTDMATSIQGKIS